MRLSAESLLPETYTPVVPLMLQASLCSSKALVGRARTLPSEDSSPRPRGLHISPLSTGRCPPAVSLRSCTGRWPPSIARTGEALPPGQETHVPKSPPASCSSPMWSWGSMHGCHHPRILNFWIRASPFYFAQSSGLGCHVLGEDVQGVHTWEPGHRAPPPRISPDGSRLGWGHPWKRSRCHTGPGL